MESGDSNKNSGWDGGVQRHGKAIANHQRNLTKRLRGSEGEPQESESGLSMWSQLSNDEVSICR
jgi:hypothetical protein